MWTASIHHLTSKTLSNFELRRTCTRQSPDPPTNAGESARRSAGKKTIAGKIAGSSPGNPLCLGEAQQQHSSQHSSQQSSFSRHSPALLGDQGCLSPVAVRLESSSQTSSHKVCWPTSHHVMPNCFFKVIFFWDVQRFAHCYAMLSNAKHPLFRDRHRDRRLRRRAQQGSVPEKHSATPLVR